MMMQNSHGDQTIKHTRKSSCKKSSRSKSCHKSGDSKEEGVIVSEDTEDVDAIHKLAGLDISGRNDITHGIERKRKSIKSGATGAAARKSHSLSESQSPSQHKDYGK